RGHPARLDPVLGAPWRPRRPRVRRRAPARRRLPDRGHRPPDGHRRPAELALRPGAVGRPGGGGGQALGLRPDPGHPARGHRGPAHRHPAAPPPGPRGPGRHGRDRGPDLPVPVPGRPRPARPAPPGPPRPSTLRVANPLSEEAPELRTTLLPGLAEVARRNLARGLDGVAVYEL